MQREKNELWNNFRSVNNTHVTDVFKGVRPEKMWGNNVSVFQNEDTLKSTDPSFFSEFKIQKSWRTLPKTHYN